MPPFETLSHHHEIIIQNFPIEWLPFLHFYDPDIPLFPLQYFHIISPEIRSESQASSTDRAFGYIERAHYTDDGLKVVVVCNKDLSQQENSSYLNSVSQEVKERLGIQNPVTITDIINPFRTPYATANPLLIELWQRVVSESLSDCLPFGRFFDHVLGLGRCVASFYSPGGRKSEWIETHYYCSKFGEEISIASSLPKMDFYLLPTLKDIFNPNNSLILFPKFQGLVTASDDFHQTYCATNSIATDLTFSKFNAPFSGTINTQKIISCINQLNASSIEPLIQCFNAFDKGPLRTVLFIQMLNDWISRRLNPQLLTSRQFGLIYDELKGFYQTPKVIALFAQQCFGNTEAFPKDTWIETFMKWPLSIHPVRGKLVQSILENASNLGKVERLLWMAAQARKIHSSLCNDALWCAKYDSRGKPRGANPLACNACLQVIRNVCPAYLRIADEVVCFNTPRALNRFSVETDQRNNTAPNQRFVLCEGVGPYGAVHDDFTPIDVPTAFLPYPQPNHQGQVMTVNQFVNIY